MKMTNMDIEEVLVNEREEEIQEEEHVVEVTFEGKKKGKAKAKKKTKVRKPNKYTEEWTKLLPRSSNVVSMNNHVFKEPYFLCKDVVCPQTNGFSLFMYFYHNRNMNIPIYNPWKRNMENLIFLKVFIDVDLVKALINSYNPATKSFHRHNGSILCTIDRTSFIEAFGLEGQMDVPIDVEDLQGRFERNKSHYINNVIKPHIPFSIKKAGQIPKEVEKHLPLSKFKGYFENTKNFLHKNA